MGGIGLLLFLATVVESANGYNILFSRTKALENSLVLRPRIPSPFRTMSLEKVGSACSPQTLASSFDGARLALKKSKLMGTTIPSVWVPGQQFHFGEKLSMFEFGEVVVFKQRFAIVQMQQDSGMWYVECVDSSENSKPGSRSFRSLGPSVLGRISADALQRLLVD